MTSRERKAILWFSAALLACLLVTSPVIYDSRRMAWLRREARTLKVGDSKAKVERTLGRANEAWEELTTKGNPLVELDRQGRIWLSVVMSFEAGTDMEIHELWRYRRRIDWRNSLRREFPFVWPFRGRNLFSDQSDDDVIISFDGEGNVSAITACGAFIVGPDQVFMDD